MSTLSKGHFALSNIRVICDIHPLNYYAFGLPYLQAAAIAQYAKALIGSERAGLEAQHKVFVLFILNPDEWAAVKGRLSSDGQSRAAIRPIS